MSKKVFRTRLKKRLIIQESDEPSLAIETNSPIFKNRKSIDECIIEDQLQESIIDKRSQKKIMKSNCDDKLYSYIRKFFNENETINDLLKSLFKLYNYKKNIDNTFTLTLRDFIELFPRDASIKGFNFKKQHVFEQICRVMLLLNYDNDFFGKNKVFFNSLEGYLKTDRKPLSKLDILESKINDGSAAQSVDIFFKINNKKRNNDSHNLATCERDYNIHDDDDKDKDLYILIQNKFYDNEKSSADKYDVTKISHRARLLSDKRFNQSLFNIVLMVNNKQLLDDKIMRNRNNDFGLVSHIFGLAELEVWFQNMLFDMFKAADYDDFIKLGNKLTNDAFQPRFHQELIVNTTFNHLNNPDDPRKKFVWGCVPRSGKSYMMAGMIKKRNTNNDILIILGAKTETEAQFVSMFKAYHDFNHYGIVTCKYDITRERKRGKTKFIFILSQEKIKVNRSDVFSDKFITDFQPLFDNKNIDMYFDEIHKGGSTIMSQDKIVNSLIQSNIKIHLFVMVTATYARPLIAYNDIISNKSPIILKWSYTDQQNMKQITNPQIIKEFIDSRNNDIEKNVILSLFTEYQSRYGDEYLNVLEDYYSRYPELVIINPFIDVKNADFNLHGNLFKLKCSAIGKNLGELRDPNLIFEDNKSLLNLIDYIGSVNDESQTLTPDSIYGNMKYKYGFDVVNKRHSQLWFLPYNNLYTNRDECVKYTSTKYDREITGYEGDENDDEAGMKYASLPNIEPLSRGIAINLLKNKFFRENFCFLIVHGQNTFDFYGNQVNNVFTDKQCVLRSRSEKGSLNDTIEAFEEKAFASGKSLIILTGAKLRLGVSLPCADIAFNFDNIASVDQNYQTMFRVLTERNNKKFGYYFDFYPERSITFLYRFSEAYGASENTSFKNMDDLVIHLQSLLYLFNYNGLSIVKANEKESLKLYDTLITSLELNKEGYFKHYTQNGAKTIEKILVSSGDKETIDMLKRFVVKKKEKDAPKQLRKTLKEGVAKERSLYRGDMDDDLDDEDDDESSDNDDDDVTVAEISRMLFTIVSMISIFSDKENYDCSDLIGCLNNILERIEKFSEFCEEKTYDVLGCYMTMFNNYTAARYSRVLRAVRDIVSKRTLLSSSILIIFANIKDNIGMKQELIKNMTSEKIMETIEKYLPVKKDEKDKFGEVFTPMSLINEMLDALPSDVWKNPNLKWLDPANGVGNFPMVAFERLNKGLANVAGYKNEEKRKNHIINNMLYMVELNPKNVSVSKKIFGKDANIFKGSFLEDGWKKKFGIDKFDIIMGNPPYNEGGIRSKTTTKIKKDIKGKARTIWTLFVEKALIYLNTNKYLCFINPASWISLKSKTSIMLLSKQIECIRYYNVVDSLKLFKTSGEIPLTYYLIKNINTKNDTKIYDNCFKEFIEFNIYKNNFIPTEVISIFNKIYKYTKQYGSLKSKVVNPGLINILSNKKTKTYIYPIISINQKIIQVKYSNKKNYDIGKPKLIFTNSTMGYPIIDKYGVLFNNGSDKYYIVSDNMKELKQIQNFFYTPLIFYLINITRTRQKFLNNKIFEILPDITKFIDEIDIDNSTLLNIFNLNNKEKKCLKIYTEQGEGRLTYKQISQFKAFTGPKILKKTRKKGHSGGFNKTITQPKLLSFIKPVKSKKHKRISNKKTRKNK